MERILSEDAVVLPVHSSLKEKMDVRNGRISVMLGGSDHFIAPLLPHLKNRFDIDLVPQPPRRFLFPGRMGEFISGLKERIDITRRARKSDLQLFEWASQPLVKATSMRKRGRIAARLHRHELFGWADRVDWEKVDSLVLVSNAMDRRFRKRFPEMEGRTRVINNTVDAGWITFRPHRELTGRLCIIGDIIPRKGVLELVSAMPGLLKNVPQASLSIVGRGPDREYLERIRREIKSLGLGNKVEISGYVEDLDRFLGEVDMVISNSEHESFHATLQEGRAAGCISISRNWDGSEEFIPIDRSFKDIDGMIEVVDRIMEMDEDALRSERDRARKEVESRYSPKVIGNEWLNWLDDCLSR